MVRLLAVLCQGEQVVHGRSHRGDLLREIQRPLRVRGRQVHHTLGFVIYNLTDELYGEFSNASFFRPERSLVVSYRLRG
jgi:hypothetical protein